MIKGSPADYQPPQSKLLGIFRGVVEDNDDPLKAGRCRIRIFGVHTDTTIKSVTEGIPTNELQWSEPALPIIEGAVTGYGLWGVPLEGSHVFVFFESGNHMQPRYFASAPGIVSGTPDFPSTSYPYLVRLATHAGHIIELDNTPGSERVRIYHSGGTMIEMDASSNLNVTVIGDESETIGGSLTINVTGTANVTANTVNIDGGAGGLDGVITGQSICHFTGHVHGDKSTDVNCSK